MKLSLKHYVIILGSLLAAYFHLVLFPDIGFTLNGLGYLGLLGAYFYRFPSFSSDTNWSGGDWSATPC
ncbi:hypothetical protein [Candidatus Villigracilis affinis]|uniref:hypothetical protein n=1 Tax=Candidatus Villigracilis affinis TaxID=3140682 RepID=UPI001DA4DA5F|nr:hypothetical protein [Anaerolineales bacterium]